jgi:hypothetical protein
MCSWTDRKIISDDAYVNRCKLVEVAICAVTLRIVVSVTLIDISANEIYLY